MLKFAKVVGMSLLLSLMLVACANPAEFFLTGRTYDDQETPTPRSFNATQMAEVVRIRAVDVQGLPVEVTAGEANNLVVSYQAGNELAVLGEVSAIIGGLLELNYAEIDFVTFTPMTEGATGVDVSTNAIEAWYNRQISPEQYIAILQGTSPDTYAEPEPMTGTDTMTGTGTVTGTNVMTGTQ